jgi:FMN phosphatase YigB (HAD superfamily)
MFSKRSMERMIIKETKVLAFDIFNTLVDIKQARPQDVKAYGRHLDMYAVTKEWRPLVFPDYFKHLPLFHDVWNGLDRLRQGFYCITLSNAPISLQIPLFNRNKLHMDFLTPLEFYRTFKPCIDAYAFLPKLLGVVPAEIMMVTANKTFGDLEAAERLGMTPMLIRDESGLCDLYSLAALLNC